MFKEIVEAKLTKAQEKQLEMLKDGEWHNAYNNGVKGLKHQTLEALVKKGLVEMKKDIDVNRNSEIFGKYTMHPDRDLFFRLK